MKKIKTVRLKKPINNGICELIIDTPFMWNKRKEKWRYVYYLPSGKIVYFEYSNEEILANSDGEGTDTFQVEFEDENFGIEVPNVSILEKGYCITVFNYIMYAGYHCSQDLEQAYLSGNWFATKQEAEAEAKRRKIKFALNKLRNEANEKYDSRYYPSYVLLSDNENDVLGCSVGNGSKGLFTFNNYSSFDYFRTKLDQSPELKVGLIELLERGSL